METGYAIKFGIEIVVSIAFVVGFCFEDRIASCEEKLFRKISSMMRRNRK